MTWFRSAIAWAVKRFAEWIAAFYEVWLDWAIAAVIGFLNLLLATVNLPTFDFNEVKNFAEIANRFVPLDVAIQTGTTFFAIRFVLLCWRMARGLVMR